MTNTPAREGLPELPDYLVRAITEHSPSYTAGMEIASLAMRFAAEHALAAIAALTQHAEAGAVEPFGYIDAEEMARHKREGAGGGIVCGNYSERYGRTTPLFLHPAQPASQQAHPTGDGVRGLVEKWRQEAASTIKDAPSPYAQSKADISVLDKAVQKRDCADELAAALDQEKGR